MKKNIYQTKNYNISISVHNNVDVIFLFTFKYSTII